MEKLAYYLQIGTTSSSMIFALVFVFYNWNKSLFKKILSIQFIVLSYGLFVNFIAINDFLALFPHFSRTGLLCALLIPPIQFLAVNTSLNKRKLQWKDGLHFLPALLYLVNYFNYFILSAEKKILLLEHTSIAAFNEGFLPANVLPILSLLQTTFYLVWFGILVRKIRKEITSETIRYFYFFMMIYMVFHYLPTFMLILYYYDTHTITSWIPVIYAKVNLIFFFKILATPEWLFYQKNQPSVLTNEPKKATLSKIEINPLEQFLLSKLTPNKSILSSDEKHLFERFTTVVEAERLFLTPSFGQKEIAEKLEVSEYKLRQLIDKVYGIKFSDFTNYRRTYFLINEMRKNPQWQRYSFVAIARKLGYLSANSFYLNFKRISGVTPKEYFQAED
ncbi:helix-turn-helix domain-containing protein [Flavobacterium sp.]|jgi:AraC-like DNA-binding protein|uniref:helix-turn-helix transcriptional regulator n=1 Tax=Flavobacterium sp. TaxID=239 RepID=UPI0037BFE81D